MLRTSFALLATLSFSACAFNDDGQLILCTENHCDTDTTEPPGPQPAPGPFTFSWDNGGFQSAYQLATDGVMLVHVDVRNETPAELSAKYDTFQLATLSSVPRVAEVELLGVHPGTGAIVATLPTATVEFPVTVADVATAGIAVGFGLVGERHVVLGDIRELSAQLRSAQGEALVDHSIAIDPSSDAGFTQTRWDSITLPETPGERVLVLNRRSGGNLSASIRTVDHIDTIVADLVQPFRVCVHAEVDGEVVSTDAWQLTGNDKLFVIETNRNCIEFTDAKPGATITASLAGTTAELVVIPSAM